MILSGPAARQVGMDGYFRPTVKHTEFGGGFSPAAQNQPTTSGERGALPCIVGGAVGSGLGAGVGSSGVAG